MIDNQVKIVRSIKSFPKIVEKYFNSELDWFYEDDHVIKSLFI